MIFSPLKLTALQKYIFTIVLLLYFSVPLKPVHFKENGQERMTRCKELCPEIASSNILQALFPNSQTVSSDRWTF
jgi:hypothetical protein